MDDARNPYTSDAWRSNGPPASFLVHNTGPYSMCCVEKNSQRKRAHINLYTRRASESKPKYLRRCRYQRHDNPSSSVPDPPPCLTNHCQIPTLSPLSILCSPLTASSSPPSGCDNKSAFDIIRTCPFRISPRLGRPRRGGGDGPSFHRNSFLVLDRFLPRRREAGERLNCSSDRDRYR